MNRETLIHDAIITAALKAWETNEPQAVNGYSIMVIPDVVLAAMDAQLASQGEVRVPPTLPTFWIEEHGRRAQIMWHTGPGSGPVE